MIKKGLLFLFTCLLWAGLTGCGSSLLTTAPIDSKVKNGLQVPLKNAEGSLIGHATLTETTEGVAIHIEAAGLLPGLHGIHLHENGSCEGPDFTSAGPHFNPLGKHHGLENAQGYHAGDLLNLIVNGQGQANMNFVSKAITLKPNKPGSLIKSGGTSLIIHEQADDLRTDPTGNSGKRIACGVVK